LYTANDTGFDISLIVSAGIKCLAKSEVFYFYQIHLKNDIEIIMPIIFLIFIIVPVIEMYLLIKVGAVIGGLYTIGLVLLTALIGVSLLKKQGLSTFMTAQQKMQTGQMPITEIAEGLMLAVAGALLLTPGFVTDTVGFILLTPVLRQHIAKQVFQSWMKNAKQANFTSSTHFYTNQEAFRQNYSEGNDKSDVIEGEFQELPDEKIEKK
tara:strand:+ start:22338 stop:22964 length:627 start_codon:yes stop_codon:yes gene_type:complete